MKTQTRWILIIVTLLLVAGLACQTLSGSDEPEDEAAQSTAPVDEAVSSADDDGDVGSDEAGEEPVEPEDAVEEAAPTGEPVDDTAAEESGEDSGEEEFFSIGRSSNFGLPDDIGSYRMSFIMEISVVDGDEETILMGVQGDGAISTDPAASSYDFAITGIDAAAEFSSMGMVQLEDDTYFVMPTGDCLSGVFGQELFNFDQFTEAGDYVGGLDNAKLVDRNVEINGVNTDHYSFEQGDLDGSGLVDNSMSNFQGDVYISDDGYLVRIAVSGEGAQNLPVAVPVEGGRVRYQMDYFDVGQPVEIAVPEGCDSAVGSGFPMVSDAFDVFSMTGITTYLSNLSFDEIVDYYRSEMEAEGWSLDFESIFENTASFSFTKDGSTVSVSVIEDASTGAFSVIIAEQ